MVGNSPAGAGISASKRCARNASSPTKERDRTDPNTAWEILRAPLTKRCENKHADRRGHERQDRKRRLTVRPGKSMCGRPMRTHTHARARARAHTRTQRNAAHTHTYTELTSWVGRGRQAPLLRSYLPSIGVRASTCHRPHHSKQLEKAGSKFVSHSGRVMSTTAAFGGPEIRRTPGPHIPYPWPGTTPRFRSTPPQVKRPRSPVETGGGGGWTRAFNDPAHCGTTGRGRPAAQVVLPSQDPHRHGGVSILRVPPRGLGYCQQSGRPCDRTAGIALPGRLVQVRQCGPWASATGGPNPTLSLPLSCNPTQSISTGGSLRDEIFFFLLRTALKDRPKGPPTANRQLPTTANCHQPPTTNRHQPPATNRRQLPAATNRQLPTTANRLQPPTASHQPPPTTTNRHQPPVANCQPPTAANRQPPTATNHG